MTREQSKATKQAMQRYGTKQWARNPVERSWRAAIEQGVDYYRNTTRCGHSCLNCVMCRTARRRM